MSWTRLRRVLVLPIWLSTACVTGAPDPESADDPSSVLDAGSAAPDAAQSEPDAHAELGDASLVDAMQSDAGPPHDSLYARAYELLLQRCVFCHTTGGIGLTVGKLNLSTPRCAYDALVGQAARGNDCAASGAMRVIPGDAANSLLVQKLEGHQTCGVRMPDKFQPLPDAQIAIMRAWIDAGAPLDWEVVDDPQPMAPGDPAAKLSETGLFSDVVHRTLGTDVHAFQPRTQLWSDGATKRRWVYLPPGEQIDTSDMDYWIYPVGTKVWKEFSLAGRPVETRLLHKVGPGSWQMVGYMWRGDLTDADAMPDGVSGANGTTHDIPDRGTCKGCHDNMIDKLLGFTALQLSHDLGGDNLMTLVEADKLSHPPAAPFRIPGAAAAEKALGILHANCGHCHNPASAVYRAMLGRPIREGGPDLWERTTNLDTLEATVGYSSTVGQANVILPDLAMIEPGDPERSEIVLRMRDRGLGTLQMPPLGTNQVDAAGLAAVEAWIRSLPPR